LYVTTHDNKRYKLEFYGIYLEMYKLLINIDGCNADCQEIDLNYYDP
jgi:hypothetical protein